jgi:hypothetical protein
VTKEKATCKLETTPPLSVSFSGTPHLQLRHLLFIKYIHEALYSLPTSCLLGAASTVKSNYKVLFVDPDREKRTRQIRITA